MLAIPLKRGEGFPLGQGLKKYIESNFSTEEAASLDQKFTEIQTLRDKCVSAVARDTTTLEDVKVYERYFGEFLALSGNLISPFPPPKIAHACPTTLPLYCFTALLIICSAILLLYCSGYSTTLLLCYSTRLNLVHHTLYTPHPTPHTLHPTTYTLHPSATITTCSSVPVRQHGHQFVANLWGNKGVDNKGTILILHYQSPTPLSSQEGATGDKSNSNSNSSSNSNSNRISAKLFTHLHAISHLL